MVCNTVLLAQLVNANNRVVATTAIICAVLAIIFLVGLLFWVSLLLLRTWRVRVRPWVTESMAYLREFPETEKEKFDAAELTLKGVVLCLLSLLFPPLILIGLVPLYYGIRKLIAIKLSIGSAKEDRQDGPSQ